MIPLSSVTDRDVYIMCLPLNGGSVCVYDVKTHQHKTYIMKRETFKYISIGLIITFVMVLLFVFSRFYDNGNSICTDSHISIVEQCDTSIIKNRLRNLRSDFTVCHTLDQHSEFFDWVNPGNTILLTSTLNNLMEMSFAKSGTMGSMGVTDARSVTWNPKWNIIVNKCFKKSLCAKYVKETWDELRCIVNYRMCYEVNPMKIKGNYLTPANIFPSTSQFGQTILYYRNWDIKDKRHVWVLLTEKVYVHGLHEIVVFNAVVSMKEKEYKNKTMKYMLMGALELFVPISVPNGYPYNTAPKMGMMSIRTDKPYNFTDTKQTVKQLNLPVRFYVVPGTFSCKLLPTQENDEESYLNVFMLAESNIDVVVTDEIDSENCKFSLYGLKINNVTVSKTSDTISLVGRRSAEYGKMHPTYFDIDSEVESESDFEMKSTDLPKIPSSDGTLDVAHTETKNNTDANVNV